MCSVRFRRIERRPWLAIAAGLCVVAAGATGSVQAQSTLTWSAAANTTWDTSSANWNPGPVAWTANDNAVFDSTASVANRAITVSGTQSVGTLTVSDTDYSFTGGTLQYTEVTSGTWTFNQGATINSGITATLTANNRVFLTTTNNSAAGNVTITGPVTVQGTGTTWFQPDGRFTFSGNDVTLTNVIMRLNFNGGATFSFLNSNVAITSESLVDSDRGLQMPAGTMNVTSSTISTPFLIVGNGGGGTLNMTSGLIETGQFWLNPANGTAVSNLNLNGGTIAMTAFRRGGDNPGGDTTANLNLNGGTLRALENNANFLNVSSSGFATTNTRVLTGGAKFDTNGFNITVSVPIASGTAGDGGLTKLGAGALTLSDTNTYLGPTAVDAGTLIVNGNQSSANGAVTVASAATLGGTGTLGGATAISGILAPGSGGIGTLSVANDVTWNGGEDWLFELGAAGASIGSPGTSDLLSITGTNDFLKGNGSSWTFDFGGTGDLGWYKLAEWTGGTTTFTAGDFTATNLGGSNTGEFTVQGSGLYIQVVPEPSSFGLLGGLAAAAGLLVRRRLTRRGTSGD